MKKINKGKLNLIFFGFLFGLAIALAIILRFSFINTSYSHDEWYTYDIVARNITDMHIQMYDDVHLPLYFYLSKIFSIFFGLNIINLRIISALLSIIGLIIFSIFSYKWFGKEVSLISTFIISLSVFSIHHSNIARMYSLVFLLSVICFFSLLELVVNKNKRFLFLLFISNLLLIYTHFYFVFFILFEIFIIFFYWKDIKYKKEMKIYSILTFFLSIPSFLFLSIQLFRKGNNTSYADWMPVIDSEQIFYVLHKLSSGKFLLLFFSCLIFYFVIKKTKQKFDLIEKKEFFLLSIFIFCLIIPMIISFIVPMFIERYLFIFYAQFILLVSISLKELYKENRFVSLIILMIIFFLLVQTAFYTFKNDLSQEKSSLDCVKQVQNKVNFYKMQNTSFFIGRGLNVWLKEHREPNYFAEGLSNLYNIKNYTLLNYYETDIVSFFKDAEYAFVLGIVDLPGFLVNESNISVKELGRCGFYSMNAYTGYSYVVYEKKQPLINKE